MAASPAAAIASSSIRSLRCLTISTPRFFVPISSHPFAAVSQKWRILSVSAAVAQEETVMAEFEQGLVEELQEVTDEVVAVEEKAITASTKLYFGNLPYSVDSAQLAAVIQDYASPEMIEVTTSVQVRAMRKDRVGTQSLMYAVCRCGQLSGRLDHDLRKDVSGTVFLDHV